MRRKPDNVYIDEDIKKLFPDQRTFLRTLRNSYDYFNMIHPDLGLDVGKQAVVRDNDTFHMVRWLSQVRRLKIRFRVYFSDGSSYDLSGIRRNQNGCIRLLLPHPVVIKPKLLWYYANLYPEWSYFQFRMDPSFPIEDIRKALQRYQRASEPVNLLSEEEQKEQQVISRFIDQFMQTQTNDVYLFYKHSPFNSLNEKYRTLKIKAGNEVLKRYVDGKAKQAQSERRKGLK